MFSAIFTTIGVKISPTALLLMISFSSVMAIKIIATISNGCITFKSGEIAVIQYNIAELDSSATLNMYAEVITKKIFN